jgi:excisionase family DNA binding protein
MKDNFLSTEETAKILGISRQAVIKRIHSGKLKAERIGHIFAIPKSELGINNGEVLSEHQKKVIEEGVKKAVKEYGEALKKLGNE